MITIDMNDDDVLSCTEAFSIFWAKIHLLICLKEVTDSSGEQRRPLMGYHVFPDSLHEEVEERGGGLSVDGGVSGVLGPE